MNQKLQLMPKFQAAYLALRTAKNVDEVKRVRDQAEAIRLYVRQQNMGLEMQNAAAEIKLRAERRAGEMLDGTLPHKGGRPKRKRSHHVTVSPVQLKEIGELGKN